MTEWKSLDAPVTDIADLPLKRPARPIGRDRLLRSLLAMLQQNQAVVLHGAAGIGKTTVAAAVASVYAQQPGQAVLWLTVSRPPLVELVVRIGRAYGIREISSHPNPLDKMVELANLLSQHKPLIVLDGEVSAAVLAQFAARCALNIPTIVTSSSPLEGSGWQNLEVGRLSEADAVLLFKQKAKIKGGASDTAVYSIAMQVNFEPFPLSLAARSMFISRKSAADFNQGLQRLFESLDSPPVIAALTASHRALNARMRDLLLLLAATLRGEGSLAFLSAASGESAADFDQAMTILSRLYLVERFHRYGAPYYRLHPLVQGFLTTWAQQLDRHAALRQTVKAAVTDYLAASAQSDEAQQRLCSELDSFIATARWAAQDGDRQLAADIAAALSALDGFVDEAGYGYELACLQAIHTGSTLDFPDAQAVEAESPAAGEPAGADDEAAADADSGAPAADETDEDDRDAPADDDDAGDADDDEPADDSGADDDVAADDDDAGGADDDVAADDSGADDDVAADDDDADGAADDDGLQAVGIEQLQVALHVAQENGETERQLQILQAMVKLHIAAGRAADAAAAYSAALEVYEDSGARQGVLETLDGLTALLLGESAGDALGRVNLPTALALMREEPGGARLLQILPAVGRLQIDAGREADAVATYSELLEIYEGRGERQQVLETLDMLAGLLVRTNAVLTALKHIQRGLNLAQELDEPATEMYLQITRGDAHQELGESVSAVEAYEAALSLALSQADRQTEAMILHKLGLTYLDADDARQAIRTFEQANELFKQQSNRAMEGQALRGLGAVNVKLQRWSEAVNFHTSALYIAREIQDTEAEARQLRRLGRILIEAQRLPEALTRYRQALHAAYQSEDAADIVTVIVELVSLMMRSPTLVLIAELLIDDALSYDASDRDVMRLRDEIAAVKSRAAERGTPLAPVAGTAKDYAANAYHSE